VLTSDENFKEYLTGEQGLSSAVDIESAFSKLHMDMKITNVKARIADYDSRFLEIKERCKDVNIKDGALVKFYVSGISSRSVKLALESELKITEMTLNEIVDEAEGKLLADDESFRSRHAAREDEDESKPNNIKSENKYDRRHDDPKKKFHRREQKNDAEASTPPPSRPHRDNAGKCKLCGEPWSPEHWIECKKKHPIPPKKDVNAVDTNAEMNQDMKKDDKSKKVEPPITIAVQIGSITVDGLIDCGAATSCISSGLAEKLTAATNVEFGPAQFSLEMANNTYACNNTQC